MCDALTLSRAIGAVPAAVYEAFTVPEVMSCWFAPSYEVVPHVECSAVVGGIYRIELHHQDGAVFPISGVYEEVEAPHHLVFTWTWETPALEAVGSTLVRVTIVAEAEGSRVTVNHEGFPNRVFADNHREAWEGCLLRLAYLFASPGTHHVATLLAHHRLQYLRAMSDVSEDDMIRRPNGRTNHMLWIAAHIAQLRSKMAECLGQPVISPLAAFEEVISEEVCYPSWEEVQAFFFETTQFIYRGLSSVCLEDLAKPHGRALPINDASVAGMLDFLMDHEAYYLGQLMFVRTFLGYGKTATRGGSV